MDRAGVDLGVVDRAVADRAVIQQVASPQAGRVVAAADLPAAKVAVAAWQPKGANTTPVKVNKCGVEAILPRRSAYRP